MLGHAVDGAEAKYEIAAVDAGDFAVKKMFGDDVERDAIVRVVEDGNKYKFVGDVEISVTGGEALAV